jgi:hypothetical protein
VKLTADLPNQWVIAAQTSQGLIVLVNTTLALFLGLVDAAAVCGGIFLWSHRPRARWLAVASLAAQVLVIVVPGFQYRIWMLGLLGFGLNLRGERMQLGSFFIPGTQTGIEFEPGGLALILNLPAALGLVAVLMARRTKPTN